MPTQRQEISASIQTNFPDNTSQFITPTRLRNEQGLFEQYVVLNEQTASIIADAVASASVGAGFVTNAAFNGFTGSTNTFTQSIQTQVNALQAATGSYITSAQTSSMSVLSASYASGSTSASYASSSTSASYAFTATSASYAATASSAVNASDILIYVKNQSGAQIDKGKVVRITGAVGDNPLIATASYTDDANSANTLGIANENISNGGFGYVITEGTLVGIDTSAFTAGQLLYLGATGSITGSAPTAPLHNVRLGEALRIQLINGSIYVRIDNGYELGELHDVVDTTTTSSYGDLLVKSGSVWVNSFQLTGSYGLTGSLSINGTPVTPTNTGSLLVTASAVLNTITFTKGDASTFAVTVDTGSGGGGGGMNLGANVFTGSQTLSSSVIPASLLFNVSGALSSVVSESNSGNSGFGNIIFNQRTNAAQSGSAIISGSSNIIFQAGASLVAPQGLRGINNIGALVNYSGSIPTFNNNYQAGTVTSSGSAVNISGNNIIGSITIDASNIIPASESFQNNYVNATNTNIRGAYSGSTGATSATIVGNTIGGNQHLIEFAGSGSQTRGLYYSLIGGSSNTASLTTVTGSSNNSGSLVNTLIYGVGLIVSGTNINTATIGGGAFVGKYNETGSLASSKDYVFVVGAGTGNTARKTPLAVSASGLTLIRQGAELSGSTTATGSFIITGSFDNQNTTTIVSTGSITQRIHPKQVGSTTLAGKISSSFVVSPEIQIEPTSANYKVILERDMIATVGQSGSYMGTFDVTNNVLIGNSTDCYAAILKLNVLCVPGKPLAASSITASITALLQNDPAMTPTISSSYNGTLYQVWAKHAGGASSSLAYVGQEFYHSGSTQ